ncbi:MAG: tRNA dihydrouridine synthase DusB [Desulfobulbus propionicus]|nr:MAG: tRNA dihydrouridine synthase DusB [Desulfobulbus propionicus]
MDLLRDHPFLLAPLAGYSDIAFRLLCREAGAAGCFTEMISCHGVIHDQQNTLDLTRTCTEERPVILQLFGDDPEIMGEATTVINRLPIDGIDLNMGCPVRKVVKRGAGASLMRDPPRAEAIIRAVCARTSLPVTVKTRVGWGADECTAPAFAQMAEQAGAAAITVHGRTWAQGFSGQVNLRAIAAVKATVSIPVIGNGDILTYNDGLAMMQQTGCDAVMIGRGALGNPWVFQKEGRPQTLVQRLPMLERHIQLARRLLPEKRIIHRLKNQAHRYLHGIHGATAIRQAITESADSEALLDLINRYSQR